VLTARLYSMTRKRKIRRPRNFSLEELLTDTGPGPADETTLNPDLKVRERLGQETISNVRTSSATKPSKDKAKGNSS